MQVSIRCKQHLAMLDASLDDTPCSSHLCNPLYPSILSSCHLTGHLAIPTPFPLCVHAPLHHYLLEEN